MNAQSADRRKRILVAEDHNYMATVVRFRLEREGYHVTLAADGAAAWRRAAKEDFDLILTDYQMPEMDGLELCRRIREEARYAGVPIILMTAYGRGLDLEIVQRDLGIQVAYDKHFSLNDLVRSVRICLDDAPANA